MLLSDFKNLLYVHAYIAHYAWNLHIRFTYVYWCLNIISKYIRTYTHDGIYLQPPVKNMWTRMVYIKSCITKACQFLSCQGIHNVSIVVYTYVCTCLSALFMSPVSPLPCSCSSWDVTLVRWAVASESSFCTAINSASLLSSSCIHTKIVRCTIPTNN